MTKNPAFYQKLVSESGGVPPTSPQNIICRLVDPLYRAEHILDISPTVGAFVPEQFLQKLFSLKNRPICCCAFEHLFVPLVRTNSQRAVSRSNVKSLRNKQKKVTALGMALTKYVSAFPFLNMMYLEFPFSFQRCHPFM